MAEYDVDDLLDLARDKSVQGRKVLLETIGDLFSATGDHLTERERALMNDILAKLIRDFEQKVRRELSERLSTRPSASHEVIRLLANDDIEVARPILLRSDVLHDEDLIEVIQRRTQQHQLAIAMRREVSESVSDALVAGGHVDVIKSLLDNRSSQISEATMEYLVEQSRSVDTYQEPLVRRYDMTPALAKRMCLWVSAAVRSFILANFEIDPTELDDVIEGMAKEQGVLEGPEAEDHPDDPTTVLARRIAEEGKLTPEFLIQVLRQGEIPLFEALFAQMTGLRQRLLRRIVYEPGGEGLVIACRAMAIDKPAFTSIFLMSRKGRPGDQKVDPAELSRVIALYDRVREEAAVSVLKRWQRDPNYLYAINQISDATGEVAAS